MQGVTAQLYADSSVIATRKPLFIPDWSATFVTGVAVVARVSRLGKNIGKRFARRYWHEVTVCLVTRGTDAERTDALSHSFDGAIAMGEWVDVSTDRSSSRHIVVNNCDACVCDVWADEDLWSKLDDAVVEASRYVTVKMGDVIGVKITADVPIAIGDTLPATIDGKEVLKTKIK